KVYSNSLNISATGLEEFNLCHFKFFCNSGLKLKNRRRRQIGSLEQGNLIHQCLENIFGLCKNKEEFDNLTQKQINEIIKKSTEEYLECNMGGDIKRTARLESNLKRIEENILQIVCHLQNELKQSEFRPIEFEFNINKNGIAFLTADNGIEIILRGVIDRIDIYENCGEKYIRVIDYKTGKKVFSMSSLLYGINLQMLLYLFAITGSKGEYSDCDPAGVLYMPSGEIVCGRDRDESGNINEYLNKHYKMNGVVLNDRSVLNAMEKDIQGIYIPAKILKGDEGEGELLLNKRSSSCLSSSQFKKLREHTEKIIIDVCNELYNGNIDSNPLIMYGSSPCDYCDYWSICGNTPCEKFREADKNAEEKMLKIISDEKMKY
ncbi:MAG: PD-(D/E)XK nuclease family protein, partial [Oscillospiraceae bacterium]|nr:PD-(D/E)XK nuclease family protein [Oscillospiraceae bacterium]